MLRRTLESRSPLTWLSAALALSLTACGPADDGSNAPDGTSDEYVESIPGSDELSLTMADDTGASSQALSVEGYALEGQPSRIRELTQQVMDRVNAVIEATHARIRLAVEGIEPEVRTIGGFECKRWEKDGERTHWRLTNCKRDRHNRTFGFLLEGRPLDDANADYRKVFAGRGRIMARFDDKKRGMGQVGYNLDAFHALTGEGPTGKVGIGYRAVGKVRQLNVAVKQFAHEGDDTPVSGLYRFKKIRGVGGRIRFLARADLVERDENGLLVRGEDGLIERGRLAVGWKNGVGARAAAVLCGGTVGEGECVHFKQCWRKNGQVELEEMEDADGNAPRFAPAACPELPIDVEDAPAPEDVENVPGGDDDVGAPAAAEPEADPAEAE